MTNGAAGKSKNEIADIAVIGRQLAISSWHLAFVIELRSSVPPLDFKKFKTAKSVVSPTGPQHCLR